MSKIRELFSKKWFKWAALGLAVIGIAGFFGYRHYKAKKTAIPEGIAWGNGRLNGKEVDVASKLPLKVKDVYVDEGDVVKPGQAVVQMDTVTLDSELTSANERVARAREQLAVAKAAITRSHAEIELARIEKERARKLVLERAGSQKDFDVRTASLKTTTAGLQEDTARLDVAKQEVKVAEAEVVTIQSRIDDATLRAPVLGRVLYRLAEPAEVLGAGGKALTLIDLQDVYMEIFLPSDQAAAIKIGSEARITLDYDPSRVVVGYVSFVSPEAQFTPKEVETRTEREKLMFRVKIQVPKAILSQYQERAKTGVRGVGYVKIDPDAAWPAFLDKNLVRADESEQGTK
jgi:HlyD family secretion protein